MLILKILAVLAALYLLYLLTIGVNRFTLKRYNYLFINTLTLSTSLGGYAASVGGYFWYMTALKNHADILNGQILMGIGALLLLYTLYKNIMHTDETIGLVLTVVQQVIYLVAGVIGLILICLIFLAYSDAKPVYRIN